MRAHGVARATDDAAAAIGDREKYAKDVEGFSAWVNKAHFFHAQAPAGRGKTTTLVQLADRYNRSGGLAVLVDLPEWIRLLC